MLSTVDISVHISEHKPALIHVETNINTTHSEAIHTWRETNGLMNDKMSAKNIESQIMIYN